MSAIEAGLVSENPVTGERGIVLEAPGDNPERRLGVELHVRPGGGVAGEHRHPAITERLEVIEGRLGVSLDGRRSTLGPGEAVQRLLFGALAALAPRARGYRGTYPRYAEVESMGSPERARDGSP